VPGAEANFGIDLLPEVSETADTEQEARYVRRHHVTPGALRDLGITLRKGRELTAADTDGQPLAAVVSETMARELWPGQDPIGKRFHPPRRPGAAGEPEVWITVVGVAADVRHGGRIWEAQEPIARDVYLSFFQSTERQLTLWLRTGQDAAALGPELRGLVRSIDPSLPVFDLATMAERRHAEEAQFRFRALLVGLFGAVALVLTSAGIYTVLAYAVSQRTREIGIRSALGAQPREVLALVMSQGLLLVGAGAAIGLAGAAASRKLVSSLLYGITPNDPVTWAVILAVLALVALVAVYLPARRALKVDPVVALRYE
jgi:putative ABC transport system permease protein